MKTALMTYGEKYTEKDISNFFEVVSPADGKFEAKYCSDLLTGKLKDD